MAKPWLSCKGGASDPRRRLAKSFDSCAKAHQTGPKGVCPSGCLGLGDCAGECPAGALTLGAKLVPHIDREKCISCGQCQSACPRNLWVMKNDDSKVHVRCLGGMPDCLNGCVKCARCERNCPAESMKLEKKSARINDQTCKNCGLCAEWCPKSCIEHLNDTKANFAGGNPLARSW